MFLEQGCAQGWGGAQGWVPGAALQLIPSLACSWGPVLPWCHHKTSGETITVKSWEKSHQGMNLYICVHISGQNHRPWDLSSRGRLGQLLGHIFTFFCAWAHLGFITTKCKEVFRNTSTTFQLPSGTHAQPLAVCPWFAERQPGVKRKDGKHGLGEQPDFARPLLKPTWRTFWENERENVNMNPSGKHLRKKTRKTRWVAVSNENTKIVTKSLFCFWPFPSSGAGSKNILVGRRWVQKPLLPNLWYFTGNFSEEKWWDPTHHSSECLWCPPCVLWCPGTLQINREGLHSAVLRLCTPSVPIKM